MPIERAIDILEYIRHVGNGEQEYRNDACSIALDMAIQALEQEEEQEAILEDTLNKIKAEIFNVCSDNYHMPIHKLSCDEIFDIIDKYKTESEG